MSVTYIPAPDIGRDLLDAYSTISTIKAKQQQLAIEQQLAQSSLQDAAQHRALIAQQTENLKSQNDDFTSPSAVEARNSKRQTDEILGQQNVQQGAFDLSQNPIRAQMNNLKSQEYQINVDKSRSTQLHLDKLLNNQDELSDAAVKASKLELIKNGADANVAGMMAQLHAGTLIQQLLQSQQQLKAGQQQIDMGAKVLQDHDEQQRLMNLGRQVDLASKGANPQDLAKEFPENSSILSNLPNTVGQKDPKRVIMTALYNQAMGGSDEASKALASMMVKPKTPAEQQIDMQQRLLDPSYKPGDSEQQKVEKALKFLRDHPNQRPKSLFEDDSPSYIPTEDVLGGGSKGQPVQAAQTQSGTTSLSNNPGQVSQALANGTATAQGNGQPPQKTQSSQAQSGSINLNDLSTKATSAFDDIEKVISSHKDDAAKAYKANKGSKSSVDFVVQHPTDPEYSVAEDGTIYNSTKYETQKAKQPGTPVGGAFYVPPPKTEAESVIKDKEFESTVKDSFVNDSSATAAQEARYRAVLGQLSRGYNEGGVDGLKNIASVIQQKYRVGETGLTYEQMNGIAKIVRKYGAQPK